MDDKDTIRAQPAGIMLSRVIESVKLIGGATETEDDRQAANTLSVQVEVEAAGDDENTTVLSMHVEFSRGEGVPSAGELDAKAAFSFEEGTDAASAQAYISRVGCTRLFDFMRTYLKVATSFEGMDPVSLAPIDEMAYEHADSWIPEN